MENDDLFEDLAEEIQAEEEEAIDWKEKFEKEKERNEKISSDWKTEHANRQRAEAMVINTNKKLKENGIGEIDENFNLIIKPREEKTQDVNYQVERSKITDQFENGDISRVEYDNRLQQLNKQEFTALSRQETMAIVEQREREKAEKEATQNFYSKREAGLAKIQEEYPDAYNSGTQLFQKMREIYDSNQDIYCESDTVNANNTPGVRLALIKAAMESMKDSDRQLIERKRAAVTAKFSGVAPAVYQEQDNYGRQDEKYVTNLLESTGMGADSKQAARIAKLLKRANETGEFYLS